MHSALTMTSAAQKGNPGVPLKGRQIGATLQVGCRPVGLQQHPNIQEKQLAQLSAKRIQTAPNIKAKGAKRQQTLVMDLRRPAES